MKHHSSPLCLSVACGVAVLALHATASGQATTNPVKPAGPAVPTGPAKAKPVARPGWWNDTVFYEVFVRSFADSTQGPLAGDGIGDIAGLIEKLDALNDGNPATTSDLGVTGLWLMPMSESPSYHGYDTVDYRTVERDYGTNDDFKRLMVECHKRGIRVVIDLVLNHHSSKHEWFTRAADPASAFHDWYIWKDERPDYKGPWNQRVWHNGPGTPRSANGPVYYGLFGADMPDLNYRNPAVTAEMLSVSRFWLKEMGVDGFRLDAIRHLIEEGQVQDNTTATHEWLKAYRREIHGFKPDAFTVGEVWAPTDQAAAYVGDELDTVFEFELADAILHAVETADATRLVATLVKAVELYPENQFCTFLTNHDQPRVMTRFLKAAKGDADVARQNATLAAAVLMTLPGVPFVYYGEEIGLTGDKPDPDIRTPMPWNDGANGGFSSGKPWRALNGDFKTVNLAAQKTPDSLAGFYRDLIRFRLAEGPLRAGTCVIQRGTPKGIAVFYRVHGEFLDTVQINFSASPADPFAIPGHDCPEGFHLAAEEELVGLALCENGRPSMRSETGHVIRAIPPRSVFVFRSKRGGVPPKFIPLPPPPR